MQKDCLMDNPVQLHRLLLPYCYIWNRIDVILADIRTAYKLRKRLAIDVTLYRFYPFCLLSDDWNVLLKKTT